MRRQMVKKNEPVALAIVELHWSEGISQSVENSANKNF